MLKYRVAAAGLKLFSANRLTKRAYRSLGNRFGAWRRSGALKPGYISRAEGNLQAIEEKRAIANGMHVLELGTGWFHWEALFTRLFYDVKITLFDVWDNRQFPRFLRCATELRNRIEDEVDRKPEAIARAQFLLDRTLECASFDEVYELLGFNYIVEPSGSLSAIADGSVDLVISADVMEHIPRNALPRLVADFKRILTPGGRTAHQIVFEDHLNVYDSSVHAKNYLRYSDRSWRFMFENDVQYINRLQPADFRDVFTSAGFEVDAENVLGTCDISALKIAKEFQRYSREDLETTYVRVIFRRPE